MALGQARTKGCLLYGLLAIGINGCAYWLFAVQVPIIAPVSFPWSCFSFKPLNWHVLAWSPQLRLAAFMYMCVSPKPPTTHTHRALPESSKLTSSGAYCGGMDEHSGGDKQGAASKRPLAMHQQRHPVVVVVAPR